jgi:cytochrome d ubiquinol oxidase subunit II
MFAAFPHWYATLFSGFYLPLLLILLALIFRAVGFEFRAKVNKIFWKRSADHFIFWGSLMPAFIWGVALTNIVMGLPIGEDMNFTGGLFGLLSPYAILGGLASTTVFTLHGAVFLTLRTDGPLMQRATKVAQKMWIPAGLLLLAFALLGYRYTVLFDGLGLVPGTFPALAVLAFISGYFLLKMGRTGWSFAATGATILFGTVVAFEGLFPMLMPSTLNPDWSLTIYNASSSELTLTIMSVVAFLFLPLILGYQIYSYYVFRKRVTRDSIPTH